MIRIIFCCFLFCAIVPAARGDPTQAQDIRDLIQAIRLQNDLNEDRNQLLSVGYDKTKTDLVDLLENSRVKKFFEENSTVSDNSTAVLIRLDYLKNSVDGLGGKLDVFSERLTITEGLDQQQNVKIERNITDIKRIFYILVLAVIALVGAGWKIRSCWPHNDTGSD